MDRSPKSFHNPHEGNLDALERLDRACGTIRAWSVWLLSIARSQGVPQHSLKLE